MKVGSGGNLGLSREYPWTLFGPLVLFIVLWWYQINVSLVVILWAVDPCHDGIFCLGQAVFQFKGELKAHKHISLYESNTLQE